ncbi:MAG TPA: hypothetical protein VFS67_01880 [Polyangiaceae bacterium]|jgi:hypothetical protein|nr:hypothetical protein [Polyangiaceae bacterium]
MCTSPSARAGLALAVLAAGCSGPPGAGRFPGTDLGGFRVAATSTSNGCGAGALGSPAKYSFEIDLSRDGSELFWGREASGEIDADLAFEFASGVSIEITPASNTRKGCSIGRADHIVGTLREDALGNVSGFSGTLTHAFAATPSSVCSLDERIGAGLPELPCQMDYALEGQRSREPEL